MWSSFSTKNLIFKTALDRTNSKKFRKLKYYEFLCYCCIKSKNFQSKTNILEKLNYILAKKFNVTEVVKTEIKLDFLLRVLFGELGSEIIDRVMRVNLIDIEEYLKISHLIKEKSASNLTNEFLSEDRLLKSELLNQIKFM